MKGYNDYDLAYVRKQFMKNKKLLIVSIIAIAFILLIAIHGYLKETDKKSRNYCILELSEDGSYYIVTGYEGNDSSIVIPTVYKGKPVEVIGAWAFDSIEFVVTSVVISDSVRIIEEAAFEWMPYLTDVVIGRSVTEIGKKAFSTCPELKRVTFKGKSNLKTIGEYAFFDTPITDISIPSSVINMGRSVFASCDFLESANIPGSIESIGINIFYACPSLKNVTVSEGVSVIPTGMFEGCTSLEKIVIPSSVTRIERNAFASCTSLESIFIPQTVLNIYDDAFIDCENLTIYCEAPFEPSTWNSEWNISNNEVVWGYVPE